MPCDVLLIRNLVGLVCCMICNVVGAVHLGLAYSTMVGVACYVCMLNCWIWPRMTHCLACCSRELSARGPGNRISAISLFRTMMWSSDLRV